MRVGAIQIKGSGYYLPDRVAIYLTSMHGMGCNWLQRHTAWEDSEHSRLFHFPWRLVLQLQLQRGDCLIQEEPF